MLECVPAAGAGVGIVGLPDLVRVSCRPRRQLRGAEWVLAGGLLGRGLRFVSRAMGVLRSAGGRASGDCRSAVYRYRCRRAYIIYVWRVQR